MSVRRPLLRPDICHPFWFSEELSELNRSPPWTKSLAVPLQVLNRMIEDMYEGHPVGEIKLKELLGHTPLQVLGGAAVGLLVALWYPQSRFAVV